MLVFSSVARNYFLIILLASTLAGCFGATIKSESPSAEITLSANESDQFTFSVTGPEGADILYVWSSIENSTFQPKDLTLLQEGVNQSLNYTVDANFESVHYVEVVCELQKMTDSGDWETKDTVTWEIKSQMSTQTDPWDRHVFVRNQNDVDAMEGITKVQGDLVIDNISFDAYDVLGGITEINGDLVIVDNPGLKSISDLGLVNLEEPVSRLVVRNNDALTTLTGLETIQYVTQDVHVRGNAKLESLSGLEGIEVIRQSLYVTDNSRLVSFEGLDNLQELNFTFWVSDNDILRDFSGLDNLSTMQAINLHIYSNPNLVSFSGLGGFVEISGFNLSRNNLLESFAGLDNLEYIGGWAHVYYNSGLRSFSGLDKLYTVHSEFNVVGNNNLTSFFGLGNLEFIAGDMWVTKNEMLLSVEALQRLSRVAGDLTFEGNANLCTSSVETLVEDIELIEGGVKLTNNKDC